MAKRITLGAIEFNQEQRDMICAIINTFGDGQHPWADNSTFSSFTLSYLKQVLNRKKFKNVTMTKIGGRILADIQNKIISL
jgi:hypothetical protein